MRKAGFSPMLFGCTDTPQDPRAYPAGDPSLRNDEHHMTGFHEAVETHLKRSYPWRSHLINQGYEFDYDVEVYRPVSPTGDLPKVNNPALYRAEDSDTTFLTDRFLDMMPAYQGQGWFAHLTYIRPHPPFVAPAPFNGMYDLAQLEQVHGPRRGLSCALIIRQHGNAAQAGTAVNTPTETIDIAPTILDWVGQHFAGQGT